MILEHPRTAAEGQPRNAGREVIRTLNSWRFSRLPTGVPQQNQTGTITFRFVLD